MARLGIVFGSVLLATYLAFIIVPGPAYRVGEIPSHDLRSRVYFEIIDRAKTDRKRDEAVEKLPAHQRHDAALCEQTRMSVPPVVERYPRGILLVPRGQPITAGQLALLHLENKEYQRREPSANRVRRALALALVFGLLATVVVQYVVHFQPSLASSLWKVVGVCALVLLTLLATSVFSRLPGQAVLVPLTVTAMVLTIGYNPQFALLMSMSLTLASMVGLSASLSHLLVAMSGQATAILALRVVRTRTHLVKVGFVAGLAYLAMGLATGLYAQQAGRLLIDDAVRGLLWGTLAGFVVSGSLPLVEKCFGVLTDVTLHELGDGSHPLLQELVRRAPGTYTHSVTVATLAEPAAEAIGANPLLARVGSYFHDIGKMLKPDYFVENQAGENRHDTLEPGLSALIIVGHVKDGVALAEQYGLPRPIRDFIEQHHGTTLVEYFYRLALDQQRELGEAGTSSEAGGNPLEASFRYPGPKPRSRESAIVMLADAVESASRSLSNPSSSALSKLVHDLMMKRLLDGQFEESGLTLTQLHQIEESLCKSLVALYHCRIEYPRAA